MPRLRRRVAGVYTAVYYDHRGSVVLSETLRAHGMDDALYQASKALPQGATRYRVFDEEEEAARAAADMTEAMRRLTKNSSR